MIDENVDKDMLWCEYRARVPQGEEPYDEETRQLRDDIINCYLYITKRVVGKMKKAMPAHVSKEDLESLAKIGLMQAVLRYDTSLGVPFEAYCAQRARSVIMDGIREADWAPRSLRKKQRDIKQAEERLRQVLKREPTKTEVAKYLDIAEDDIDRTHYKVEISSHTYIEGNQEAQNKTSVLDSDELELVDIMKSVVAQSMRTMPIRHAAILAMHYYHEEKLSDIARKLKLSEVRVGTLHSEAVLLVWQELQKAIQEG